MAFSLTGCSFGFDASKYIQGALDAQLHGEFETYAEMTGSSESDIEELYNTSIDAEMDTFASSGLTLSAEDKQRFRDLFIELFKVTKYEVGEATKNDDGSFTVPVTFSECTALNNSIDKMTKDLEAYAKEVADSGTTIDTDQATAKAIDLLYDALSEEVKNPQYGESQTMELTVKRASNDSPYSFNTTEMTELVRKMLGTN